MNLPNFFLVGANKAGTTALAHQLNTHPEIFMSTVKEPAFFLCDGRDVKVGPDAVTSWNGYLELFSEATTEKVRGEASTWYLYDPWAPAKIAERIADAKFVAVLRNPIERAHSHYEQFRRAGIENAKTFDDAVARELKAMDDDAHDPHQPYVRMGFYADQIDRYLSRFGKDRVHMILYEQFKCAPSGILVDIFKFLGVEPTWNVDIRKQINVSGQPRSKKLEQLLTRPNPFLRIAKAFVPPATRQYVRSWLRHKNYKKTPISAHTRSMLINVYSSDSQRLSKMLDMDLSSWLEA